MLSLRKVLPCRRSTLLALLIALALPGCGSEPDTKSKPKPPPRPLAGPMPEDQPTPPKEVDFDGYCLMLPAEFEQGKPKEPSDPPPKYWVGASKTNAQVELHPQVLVDDNTEGAEDAAEVVTADFLANMKKSATSVGMTAIEIRNPEYVQLGSYNAVRLTVRATNQDKVPVLDTQYILTDANKIVTPRVFAVGANPEAAQADIDAILRSFHKAGQPVPDTNLQPQSRSEPTVTVQVSPLHEVGVKYVTDALAKAAVAKVELTSAQSGSGYNFTLKPFASIKRLAAAIKFGKVGNIDEKQRTISVEPDPLQVPQDPKLAITLPTHPDYWKLNVAALTGTDTQQRQEALTRLAAADAARAPEAMRTPIARAMKDRAFDAAESPENRVKAIDGMARWGSKFSAKLMVDLLKEKDAPIRQAAMKHMLEFNDDEAVEGAVEAVVELYVMFPEQRELAGAYLRSHDKDAEEVVLKRAPPAKKVEEAVVQQSSTENLAAMKAMLALIGEVGGPKSTKYLNTLRANKRLEPKIGEEIHAASRFIADRKK